MTLFSLSILLSPVRARPSPFQQKLAGTTDDACSALMLNRYVSES
jgi:hypothetical protein